MSLLSNIFIYTFFPLLMISFVIAVHELGHYLAARYFNASIKSFSLGFGDKIFGLQDKRGTVWKVSWLPLGGFVSFYEPEYAEPEDTVPSGVPLSELSPLKRIVVSLAGPFANFVLAIAIFAFFGMALGNPKHEISVRSVEAGTPAEAAGLQAGDIFVSLNGQPAWRQDRFQTEIKLSAGQPIEFTVRRGSREIEMTALPERMLMDNGIGIKQKMGRLGFSYFPKHVDQNRLGPVRAIAYGIGESYYSVSTSVRMIAKIVSGRESLHMLSGPVGIANTIGTAAKVSLEQDTGLGSKLLTLLLIQLQICAMISVAVGFLNLLPLPVLDGGSVVFNAYEAVTGRSPSKQLQAASTNIAFLMLIFMLVFVTFGDFGETGLLELFSGL